ncbi:PREDICTED: uncharacterized protein LOC101300576 [Fragaria vesca subsp. vesca]
MCKQEIFMELTASSLASLISDPEPFVQEKALSLVRNLVDGCMKSVELVFAEDGIILDAVGRQLQGASRDEIRIQFLPISFIPPYLKYGHKSRNISALNRSRAASFKLVERFGKQLNFGGSEDPKILGLIVGSKRKVFGEEFP